MMLPTATEPRVQPSEATLDIRAGRLEVRLHVRITPGALLAIGGMVGCILLGASTIVWTATSIRRRHPIAGALRL